MCAVSFSHMDAVCLVAPYTTARPGGLQSAWFHKVLSVSFTIRHEKAHQCHMNPKPVSCSPYLACVWASTSSSGRLSEKDICWQRFGNFYLCSYWAVVSRSVWGSAAFRYGRNIYNVRRSCLNVLPARMLVLTCCQWWFCPGPDPDTVLCCPVVACGWNLLPPVCDVPYTECV